MKRVRDQISFPTNCWQPWFNSEQPVFNASSLMCLGSYLASSIFNRWGKALDVWYADCWIAILPLFRADKVVVVHNPDRKILSLSKSIVAGRLLRFLVLSTVEIDRARVFSYFFECYAETGKDDFGAGFGFACSRHPDEFLRAIFYLHELFKHSHHRSTRAPKLHAKQTSLATINGFEIYYDWW